MPNSSLVLSASLPQALGFLALALPLLVKLSFHRPYFPMELWYRSDVTHVCLEGLIKCDLLCARTEVAEWPGAWSQGSADAARWLRRVLRTFHECGLMIPPYPFLRGLLHHY
jgi:hypothetical protein